MATALAPSAFSASTSSFRASQSAPAGAFSYSDDPSTQLPSVDFNFEDLRQRMTAFTVKFDAFIEKGRKRVLQERNEFRGRLGEIGEEQRSTGAQISTLQSTLTTHNHILSREQSEKNEMHAQISKLELHQSSQMASRDRMRSSISHTQRQIDAKVQAQREYAEKVDSQSRLNTPELGFWETYLGCRLEGSGEDNKIKVTYIFQPAKGVKGAEEREAVFDLCIPDSGNDDYKIAYMKPRLDGSKVEMVVQKLNESREVSTLLKGMRGLFIEEMK